MVIIDFLMMNYFCIIIMKLHDYGNLIFNVLADAVC